MQICSQLMADPEKNCHAIIIWTLYNVRTHVYIHAHVDTSALHPMDINHGEMQT